MNLDELLQCRALGSRIDRDIQAWLEELPLLLKKRLQKTGLVWSDGADAPRMWKEFCEWVLENHYQNKADNTIKNMKQASSAFVKFFGNCPIDSITKGDADRWREAMLADESAEATVSCYLRKCRTFFGIAVKYKMVFDNPFSGIKIPNETNDDRKFYVDHLTIKRLLKVCSPEWAAAICLCRFGGLRCPSDVFGLTWEGVNFETGRITAWRKKTSHHTVTPMSPEVRHTLSNLWDVADEGEPLVFPYYGTKNTDRAADRQLRRLLVRAGIVAWPRLTTNLRVSWGIDLKLAGVPQATIASWLDHTTDVHQAHYQHVNDNEFEMGAKVTSGIFPQDPIAMRHHPNVPPL